jgi:hypothetical protein
LRQLRHIGSTVQQLDAKRWRWPVCVLLGMWR